MYVKHNSNPMLKTFICLIFFVVVGCEGAESAPSSLHVRLLKHRSLITEGNTGAARVRVRQYMEKYGETSHPLFLMGLSYHTEKRYAKAAEWFTKSTTDLDNPYPLAWHFLGWAQFYLGDVASAQFSFEKFLQAYPEEPDSVFALGLLAMERGELQKAEALFLTVIKLSPKNKIIRAKATARLADVMVERDEWQHAIDGYKEALQRNPDLYEAWYRYGTALKRVGKMDEAELALAHFEEARKRVRPDLYQQTRFPE